MSESGPPLGYLILFTEIGVTLLVTTLLGVLAGLLPAVNAMQLKITDALRRA